MRAVLTRSRFHTEFPSFGVREIQPPINHLTRQTGRVTFNVVGCFRRTRRSSRIRRRNERLVNRRLQSLSDPLQSIRVRKIVIEGQRYGREGHSNLRSSLSHEPIIGTSLPLLSHEADLGEKVADKLERQVQSDLPGFCLAGLSRIDKI